MSNVIKLASKKKQLGIDDWQEQIEELADKLADRLYDQVRLADEEAGDEDMPEEYSECMIVGVLASVLVSITHARNVLGPEALLKLVEYEIEGQDK